jgi:hypothetical protein
MTLLFRKNRELNVCRGCGCDDEHACLTPAGPCCWIVLDIATRTGVCSVCAEDVGWNVHELIVMGAQRDEDAA